jgi:hypothetical protein
MICVESHTVKMYIDNGIVFYIISYSQNVVCNPNHKIGRKLILKQYNDYINKNINIFIKINERLFETNTTREKNVF